MSYLSQSEHLEENISTKTGIPKVCQGVPFIVKVDEKSQLINVSACECVCARTYL